MEYVEDFFFYFGNTISLTYRADFKWNKLEFALIVATP